MGGRVGGQRIGKGGNSGTVHFLVVEKCRLNESLITKYILDDNIIIVVATQYTVVATQYTGVQQLVLERGCLKFT